MQRKSLYLSILLGLFLLSLPTLALAKEERAAKKQTLPPRLEKKVIPALNFKETPLENALQFLSDITGENVYLSPGVKGDGKVTLQLQKISVKNALALILMQRGLTYEWKFGAVIILKKSKNPWTNTKIPGKFPKFFGDQKISVNFRKTPLSMVVSFLQAVTRKNFVISSRVKAKKMMVSLSATKISIQDILALVLFPHKLTFQWKNGAVVIEKYKEPVKLPSFFEERKVSLNLRETPLKEAVDFLQTVTGKNFVISSKVNSEVIKVTVQLNNVSLKEALETMLGPHGLTYTWKYGSIVIEKK